MRITPRVLLGFALDILRPPPLISPIFPSPRLSVSTPSLLHAPPSEAEGEPVALEAVRAVRSQDDIGARVVRVGVDGVTTVKEVAGGEAEVLCGEARDRRRAHGAGSCGAVRGVYSGLETGMGEC